MLSPKRPLNGECLLGALRDRTGAVRRVRLSCDELRLQRALGKGPGAFICHQMPPVLELVLTWGTEGWSRGTHPFMFRKQFPQSRRA